MKLKLHDVTPISTFDNE
jgi:hypothetical protein